MDFIDYQAAALRTALPENQTDGLVHASLGLTTEVGEFVSEVKRIAKYGKPLTQEMHDHMCEEIGDVMWYVALAAEHLGVPMKTLAKNNIAKLQKRFPDKFTNEAAEARADKGGLGHRES